MCHLHLFSFCRGYDRDPLTGKCQDVNECLASAKPVCGAFAVCKNLPGSYECECPQGYSGNPFSQCVKCTGSSCGCQPPYVQVGNQCQLAGNVTRLSTIVEIFEKNTKLLLIKVQHLVFCFVIFLSFSYFFHIFIKKIQQFLKIIWSLYFAGCSSDADCASQKATCVKITGGVSYCACPPGFQPGPDNKCTDVDECTSGLGSPCGRGATCTNIEGVFKGMF